MKVYILIGNWQYEGSDILEVFSSLQGANQRLDEFRLSPDSLSGGYDYYQIITKEVTVQ